MSAKEKNENFMKDDCDKRITKMEVLLEKASKEKDIMRAEILTLTGQVAALKTKVEYLEKENKELIAPKQTQYHKTRRAPNKTKE